MSSTYYSPLFFTVSKPPSKHSWGPFAISYVVQAAVVAAIVIGTIAAPVIAPEKWGHVDLVAPDLTPAPKAVKVKSAPVRQTAPELETAPKLVIKDVPVLHLPQPERIHKAVEIAEVQQPHLAVPAPKFDSKILNSLPGPKAVNKIVATNTFGGSSAVPTLAKMAPSKVQTGGFGDPNGVPVNANGRGNRGATLAAMGSFDLPAGGGYGNGTGGTRGARGTVASAGFGNGVAVQGGGGRGGNAGQGRIQATSFTSANVVPTSPNENHRKVASQTSPSTPVSIQSKPTPTYTVEARQLRIEGEVLLNVVFAADGRVRIMNVVRGLGHGLDESAVRAAQGVRFNPAMRDGHPVDSTAILHIIFQLS